MPLQPSNSSTDPLRDTLATALGAQYDVLVPIGRGAMGAVYLARERFLDRLVAVKVLPAESASSADARERFLREARTAARLTHPHIVPLHSFGEAGDTLFYVMGYVDGESLESRLHAMTRLSVDEATRILREIAAALHYAHAQGVVHRDLKPDNILLDRHSGRAMLADFGIARRRAEGATLTGIGMVVGTPQYMSPEQASGDKHVDGRSDLYALGVIGYRMLTGRLPFEGSNVMELLAQHMTREAPPITQPEVPASVAAVVRRALAKDPAMRWPTGEAMSAALLATERDDPDESLPDELHGATGMGTRALGFGYVFAQAAIANAIGDFFGVDFTNVMITAAVLAPAGMLALQLPRAVKHLGWRDALAVAFRQPSWWHGWWPPRWRSPRDVWERLPSVIRVPRALEMVSILLSMCAANGLLWLVTRDLPPARWITVVMLAGGLLPTVVLAPFLFRARRWSKAKGFSVIEHGRLLAEPTSRSAFWLRPEIAAVIVPREARAELPVLPRSPAEHLRAIEAMEDVDSTRNREILAEGVVVGRDLAAAIARCDTELAALDRDVSPEERARVEDRIAAQGAPEDSESEAKQRMRSLLADQLALMRGLEAKRSEFLARRERYAGHMHALWLALAQLRSDAALDMTQASEITGRIRAIQREVELRFEAEAEVRAIAP